MGSLPQDTVLLSVLQCGSFSWPAVLQKLLHHGSFPQGTVLEEQSVPVWVPHGSQILCVFLYMGFTSCQESVGSAWAAAFFRTHQFTLWAVGTQPALLWSCHRQLWWLEHLLPLLTWPWCCRTVPLPFNSLLSHSCCTMFFTLSWTGITPVPPVMGSPLGISGSI